MEAFIQCGRFRLTLEKPLIMGIINVTPDSFSGDGSAGDIKSAVAQAHRMIAEGADLLDIGAESSRPGACYIQPDEEVKRLTPVVQAVLDCGVPVSIDTWKHEVMQAMLALGVDMINDINAAQAEGVITLMQQFPTVGLVLMHKQKDPHNMQDNPSYQSVEHEVWSFLQQQYQKCCAAGIDAKRLILDPGFGFGKRFEHNRALFQALPTWKQHGHRTLVGISRKSIIGVCIEEKDPVGRVHGSVAAALLAAQKGATILRVHDVKATVDALRVWKALG